MGKSREFTSYSVLPKNQLVRKLPGRSPGRRSNWFVAGYVLLFISCTLQMDTRADAKEVGEADAAVAHERRVPLEGAGNFRDLGGYKTRDDRMTSWGMVYRSGELSGLTDHDRAVLGKLGIRTVVDLRGSDQRQSAPAAISDSMHIRQVLLPISPHTPPDFNQRLLSNELSEADVAEQMKEYYRSFARDFTQQYSTYIRDVAEGGDRPVVVNCSAGKDRTGMAAAVLLLALGVPKETVMEDFLLSNAYVDVKQLRNRMRLNQMPIPQSIDDKVLMPLLTVARSYLEAAFEVMEDEYGSVDGYLRDGLNLSPEFLDKLRAQLVQ